MKTLLVIVCWAIAMVGFSQTNKEIVATLVGYSFNVFAKDSETFSENERNTLSALINKAEDSANVIIALQGTITLKSVGTTVSDWYKAGSRVESADGYSDLVKQMAKKLTDGGVMKAKEWRRKNVPQLFTDKANEYLKSVNVKVEGADETLPPATVENASLQTAVLPPIVSSDNSLLYVSLGLGVLSFLGVIVLLLYINSLQKKQDRNRRDTNLKIDNLSAYFNDFKSNGATSASGQNEKLNAIEQKLQIVEKSFTNIQSQLRSAKETSINTQRRPEQPATVAATQPARETTTLYAQMPDQPNGFSSTALSNRQSGEEAYEIEVNGNNATFIISNDSKAQRYALSDFRFFLEKGCELLNEPTPNCRIHTQEVGTLVKNGNVWTIQNKAKITFA